MYAGGRIDVYGLSEDDYYEGKTAISLPVMTASSFNALSVFLSNFSSSSALSYDNLMILYLAEGNPALEYAPEVLAT